MAWELRRIPLAAWAITQVSLVLLFTLPTAAQEQLWITQWGTEYNDTVRSLAPDGSGGVMVVGETGRGTGTGPPVIDLDAYVARYNSAGDRLWITEFGTSEDEWGRAVARSDARGAFVGGATRGSLGGPHAGRHDAFLARFDREGHQLWVRQFGTSESDEVMALAPDGAGGVIAAGRTKGFLVGPIMTYDMYHAFMARYDDQGNQLWILQFNWREWSEANALASDGQGGVYVTGLISGSHLSDADAFVARYDGAGNQLWIREFGTLEDDEALALSPDGAGGVMVAGRTEGSLGGLSAGEYDAFLTRFDGAGYQLWIRQFGMELRDEAVSLATDGAGGVMIAGYTEEHRGRGDAYLARYDGAGDLIWFRQFGTSLSDWAGAVANDLTGGVMVGGGTRWSLGGPYVGYVDAFLARYTIETCYVDCDHSTGIGVLDIFDFLCWQNDFVTGNSYACDCDTSTGLLVCDVFDFLCFQDAFVGGCP